MKTATFIFLFFEDIFIVIYFRVHDSIQKKQNTKCITHKTNMVVEKSFYTILIDLLYSEIK